MGGWLFTVKYIFSVTCTEGSLGPIFLSLQFDSCLNEQSLGKKSWSACASVTGYQKCTLQRLAPPTWVQNDPSYAPRAIVQLHAGLFRCSTTFSGSRTSAPCAARTGPVGHAHVARVTTSQFRGPTPRQIRHALDDTPDPRKVRRCNY